MKLILLIVICAIIESVFSARILCFFPSPSKSHLVVFTALTKELAARGHELVVVSPFPLENPPKNYKDINLFPDMKHLYFEALGVELFELVDISNIFIPVMFWEEGITYSNITLNNKQVKELLNDKQGFDLVIVEDFMFESLYPFADYFKAPLVLISSLGGLHTINYVFGSPLELSYMPDNMLQYSDKMTFLERLENVLYTWFWDIGCYIYYLPAQEKLRQKFFGDSTKSVWQLKNTASLALLNSHISLNFPRPLVPAIIEVGGMQVKQNIKQLPKDLKKYLDDAKNGAIYFSMGSNLKIEFMPKIRRNAIFEAFAEIPHIRILMRCENETIPSNIKNVKCGKWLPQQDILGHPNVKLFITHGGLLSLQESAYHGMPLIGIPIFGDQMLNMKRAQNDGYAIMLEFNNLTKTSLLWSINKVFNDKRINIEAKKRSLIFKDQPQTPLERAVYWIEYVLRHKGASHLRSSAVDLPWYQIHLFDVYLFIFIIIILFIFLLKFIFKFLCYFKNNKNQLTDKKNK